MTAGFVARPVTQLPVGDKAEVPPKRPGRPGRPPTKSLEPQIGSLLTFINLIVMSLPPVQKDAMDQYEIVALAKALDQQAKASPRFRKYLEGLLGAGAGAGLLGVIMMIGMRRASRHGLMPNEMDALLGSLIQGASSVTPTGAPASAAGA